MKKITYLKSNKNNFFIKHKIKLTLIFFVLFLPISIIAQEFGTNDFRISDAGGIGDAGIDAMDSDVAYNTLTNQYLVVWEADDPDLAGGVNNKFEIVGQFIDANGAEVGVDFSISNFPIAGNTSYDAVDPAVAYNSTTNEYLVIWSGDRIVFEDEIYGQLISATGTAIGSNFRISDLGPDDDTDFDAYNPEVVYNETDNEYFVIFRGDDVNNLENEIFGQRISATGVELGTNDFLISTGFPDPSFDAAEPHVTWNSTDNEYLVVWINDIVTGNIEEVVGQRLNGTTAALIGTHFRISHITDVDSAFDAQSPNLIYNKTDNQYLVVWNADRTAGEEEIYGQLISNIGVEIGVDDFKISTQGTDDDTSVDAVDPDVAWRPTTNTYMVVWEGDDVVVGGDEIWMQEITSTGTLSGAVIQVSDIGPSVVGSVDPRVIANTEEALLITWEADDTTGGLVEGEAEIYIQMYGSPALDVKRFTKSELSIYPNPVNNGLLNIESTILGEKNIQLYDVMGRQVVSTKLASNQFNTKSINPGLYFLKVSIEDRSSTLKIIIN